jgi:hypothetical protein
MKKTLKVTGLVLLVLLVLAFTLPFIFKGKITALIKDQINQHLTAKVDFSDVDLSLFRHFPRLAVALDSLRVTGTGEFAADTLVAARRIDVAVDVMSAISGKQLRIHSIRIDQPRIHALVHANGHVNWAITVPDTATAAAPASTSGGAFAMALQKYSITDGYLEYRDDSSHMSTEITGIQHSGGGDFTSDQFVLNTSTHIESLSFTYGLIPYLVKAQTKVAADFQVDNTTGKYSFKTDDLVINELKLHTEGYFQLVNDSTYDMDIKFNGPSLDFKHILSLVPAFYRNNLSGIKTSGEASLDGFVKGRYDSRHIPAYHVVLGVKNGMFQYPDLPLPVTHINLSLKADNPDGAPDHTVVDIPQGHFEMEGAPFDFRLLLKTPVSDPYLDMAAKGKLDLGKVSRFMKLESGTRLAGLLNADMSMTGNLSALEKQQFEAFNASGAIGLTNFSYASAAYPSGISLENLQMSFNPKNVTLSDLKGVYGKMHFMAHGAVNNLPVYLLKHQPLDGTLTVQADEVDLNALMGTAATGQGGGSAGGTGDPAASTTGASGKKDTTATTVFAVPANIRFLLVASADRVLYDHLLLQHVTGNLTIADETVKLENVRAEGLDGTMVINGAYSTKNNPQHPDFAFAYDVQQLDVQKTYTAFVTMQQLMPAAKYIAGKFSSRLTMLGKLGAGMKPDLNTMSGEGRLQLTNGVLKGFAPTDKLAQTLHLDALKEMPLNDIKTAFSFRNGRVIVDPFPVRLKDIDMEVSGTHGFDQTLDYSIDMKLPRSMLGNDAGNLMNTVAANAAAHGATINMKEKIDLPVKVGGTTTSPVIRADVKGALSSTAASLKQQAAGLVQARVDSAKQQLKDTAKAVGQQLLTATADDLKKRLTGKSDTTAGSGQDAKKKLESTGKGMLDNLFNKKKSN